MLKQATVLAAALALAAPAAAQAGFTQPVHVIWQRTGTTPGAGFGWAVSGLADVNHDGAADAIIGEPFPDRGTTWVLSGATGAVLRSFEGEPGDANGYAIADAGDTNRDGYHDVISGAPGQTAAAVGRAYLYSGRDGRLLHVFAGYATSEAFGSAVSSAGDVDHDGHADLLIGAPGHVGGGIAYVFSGRTYRPLYAIPAPDATHAFGAGTGTTDDVDGDRVPDEIVGGGGAGYVFSGATGRELYALPPSAAAKQFGTFFLAGVGDVNGDRVPDVYGGDYDAADNGPGSGFAAVYSGRDGTPLHHWPGPAGAGTGPGRGAGDVDGDHRPDIAVGSYTSSDGAPNAGRIDIFSGRTGKPLRTITSTTPNEQLGFDAVGVGDVNRDRRPDLLASAANGDTVYMIAGERRGSSDSSGCPPTRSHCR
jgi:hypothetical protein